MIRLVDIFFIIFESFFFIRTNNSRTKGFQYIIIIYGRIVNIYVNNVLEISKILPSLPVIYDISSEIVLGQVNNNFHGKIRNLTLYPFPLHFNDVQNID